MNESMPIRGAAVHGAVAGLVGGFAYASVRMVGSGDAMAGYAAHLVVAVVLGAGFGMLLRARRTEPGELLFWGLAYGMFWWYLGVLVSSGWNITAAKADFPYLIGLLLYGAVTALILILLRRPADGGVPVWKLVVRGGAAGLIASAVTGAPWPLLLGAGAGVIFVLLHPAAGTSTGPAMARGMGFGFLFWLAIPVTAAPLLRDGRLAWSVEQVRDQFPALVAALLLGIAIGAVSAWISGLGRLLLADPADRADQESLGSRTLSAVLRGAAGGIAGGLIFTVIMVQIGYLGTVAGLVGSTSAGVGLAVHLAISVILGATYGLFFRRQSDDLTAGIGWGMSWGLLWWVLGALTLLPTWLGGTPQWTAADAAAAFPSLIGHLGFGAALGAVFHVLEARHDPWWMRRTAPTSAQARLLRQSRRLAATAPAVWSLNALITVTVIVLLG